ncbi:NAD(P)H-binding protein, partial [Pseudomonas syringae group genomosp. 3]
MSRIFVIGAAGKVGQRLIKNLGDSGHEVIALHRKQEQAALIKATGALPLLGNLVEMDAPALASAM